MDIVNHDTSQSGNSPPAGRITVREVKLAVCGAFDIPMIEMVSERRARKVSRPRQVAMYLSRELTPFSLPSIGRMFGNRDHTTILHGIRQVERRMGEDVAFKATVEGLKADLSTTREEPCNNPTSEQFFQTA